jgi:hypothetical protein
MTDPVSLDGRRFRAPDDGGVYECREQAGIVWGRYTGEAVKVGLLVGTRDGDVIDLRCFHVDAAGTTASTAIRAQVVLLDDGRVRLDGAPVLEEVTPP